MASKGEEINFADGSNGPDLLPLQSIQWNKKEKDKVGRHIHSHAVDINKEQNVIKRKKVEIVDESAGPVLLAKKEFVQRDK